MKTFQNNSTASVIDQLLTLEDNMLVLMNQLSVSERLEYLNAHIVRMYSSPRRIISAADKIQLVVAHRKGNTLTQEQQERIKLLTDITNKFYDLENGNNE